MKRIISLVLACVLLVGCVAVFASCGKKISGTYEAEINAVVAKYTATYDFSGSKVSITKKATVLGNVNTTNFEGKYEIAENDDGTMEITITLESEDDEIKSGTYTFEEGEDYIKIAGIKYSKVEK